MQVIRACGFLATPLSGISKTNSGPGSRGGPIICSRGVTAAGLSMRGMRAPVVNTAHLVMQMTRYETGSDISTMKLNMCNLFTVYLSIRVRPMFSLLLNYARGIRDGTVTEWIASGSLLVVNVLMVKIGRYKLV